MTDQPEAKPEITMQEIWLQAHQILHSRAINLFMRPLLFNGQLTPSWEFIANLGPVFAAVPLDTDFAKLPDYVDELVERITDGLAASVKEQQAVQRATMEEARKAEGQRLDGQAAASGQ